MMMRFRKVTACLMVVSVLLMCACDKTTGHGSGVNKNSEMSKPEHKNSIQTDPSDPDIIPTPTAEPDSGIVDMTMFITMVGSDKNGDNDIKELIAEKTGVRVDETWLTGMYAEEAVSVMMASGELTDFIDGGESNIELYYNGMLVAWDEYLEKYPNLKEMYTDEEWERFRMDDGHIYWANVFDNQYLRDTTTTHTGQAFWIQARVLEWAGYPAVETLDQYFDLLESFAEANPELPDGTPVIPYTCLCDSWRYFCLENAPMYLDGYPYDGCVIVNVEDGINNPKVVDYNTTATAENYFRKLNEEYNKGVIDPDFAVQTYDEYISKLLTGCVLGMNDQYWDFAYTIKDQFATLRPASDGSSFSLSEIGCDYIPLGLVSEPGMPQQWHTYGSEIDYSSGIAVTTSCVDPDLAFKFMNDILDQEIHDLRFWGIEGVDYLVDSQGTYYRTQEMMDNWSLERYKNAHTCEYSYMPQWRGMSRDGRNCMMPEDQPSIFKEGLSKPVVKCFEAYGVNNYVEMIGSEYREHTPWYPLWTWSNSLTDNTPGGLAWDRMGLCKHEWLPKLVISNDFDETWEEYMEAYQKCDPQAFLDEAQTEVEKRLST